MCGVALGRIFLDVACCKQARQMRAKVTLVLDVLSVGSFAEFADRCLTRRARYSERFREDGLGLDHEASLR